MYLNIVTQEHQNRAINEMNHIIWHINVYITKFCWRLFSCCSQRNGQRASCTVQNHINDNNLHLPIKSAGASKKWVQFVHILVIIRKIQWWGGTLRLVHCHCIFILRCTNCKHTIKLTTMTLILVVFRH